MTLPLHGVPTFLKTNLGAPHDFWQIFLLMFLRSFLFLQLGLKPTSGGGARGGGFYEGFTCKDMSGFQSKEQIYANSPLGPDVVSIGQKISHRVQIQH